MQQQLVIDEVNVHAPAKGRMIEGQISHVVMADGPNGVVAMSCMVKLYADTPAQLQSRGETFKEDVNKSNVEVKYYTDKPESGDPEPLEHIDLGEYGSPGRAYQHVTCRVEIDERRATATTLWAEVSVSADFGIEGFLIGLHGPITMTTQVDSGGFITKSLSANFMRTPGKTPRQSYDDARPTLVGPTWLDIGEDNMLLVDEGFSESRTPPFALAAELTASEDIGKLTAPGLTTSGITVTFEEVADWPNDPDAGPRPTTAEAEITLTVDKRVFEDPLATLWDLNEGLIQQAVEEQSGAEEIELVNVRITPQYESSMVIISATYLINNTNVFSYTWAEEEDQTIHEYQNRDFDGFDTLQKRPGPDDFSRRVTITRVGLNQENLDRTSQHEFGADYALMTQDLQAVGSRRREYRARNIRRGAAIPVENKWGEVYSQTTTFELVAWNPKHGTPRGPVTGGGR
jgi:hypothetical protein